MIFSLRIYTNWIYCFFCCRH